MSTPYAPIDFFGEQFIIGSHAFDGFRKRELVRVIKGCGGRLYHLSRCSENLLPAGLVRSWDEVDAIHQVAGAMYVEEDIVASTGLGLSTHERMSMLRGALQGEPSLEAWRFAVAVLEAWPRERGHADALRYVADLTRVWLADVREGSPRWLKRAVSGRGVELPLAGRLTLRNGMFTPTEIPRALAAATGLRHLRVELRGAYAFELAQLEAILKACQGLGLRSLRLGFTIAWPVATRELVVRLVPADLEVLEVRDRYVYQRGGATYSWPFEAEELRHLDKARPGLELRRFDRRGDVTCARRGGVDREIPHG